MMSSRQRVCSLIGSCSLALLAIPCSAQAVNTVMRMAANEKIARAEHRYFTYRSEERSNRTGHHLWTEKVVETNAGVLHRLIAVDGHALGIKEALQENTRLHEIVLHPESLRKANAEREADEQRLTQLLTILPAALLVQAGREEGGCRRYALLTNSSFHPSSIEERIVHALEGTVWVKEPENRLCGLNVEVTTPIDVGFGLLGHLNSGGYVRLRRAPVGASQWKTIQLSVHIEGKALLLASIVRDQEVTRAEIHALARSPTLQEAFELSMP